MYKNLHEKLISIQSTEELERKQIKARRKAIWTRESIDLAERKAKELYEFFNSGKTYKSKLNR